MACTTKRRVVSAIRAQCAKGLALWHGAGGNFGGFLFPLAGTEYELSPFVKPCHLNIKTLSFYPHFSIILLFVPRFDAFTHPEQGLLGHRFISHIGAIRSFHLPTYKRTLFSFILTLFVRPFALFSWPHHRELPDSNTPV